MRNIDIMTEKLYYSDPFTAKFEAEVRACTAAKGGFEVLLDRTAFYPEGGGQPFDLGSLGGVQVTGVHERAGEVVHTTDAPLSPGSRVEGRIDFERRFRFMQQHSGEHILSGFLHSMFGVENAGFHMGADAVTVDTSAPLSPEQLAQAELAANRYIALDREVRCRYPDAEELKTLEYRSKKEIEGALRIVEFPGADRCACCGTHVARAGQVGLVKILSAVPFRSGMRLEILCGLAAIERLGAIASENTAVSRLLSAKPLETSAAVSRTLEALAAAKAEAAELERRLCTIRADALRGAGDVVIFEQGLAPDAARRLADAVAEVCGGLCAVFAEAEPESGGRRYAAAEHGGDLAGFAKELNAALGGRGGGRGGLVQGSVNAPREDIERFMQSKFPEIRTV